MTTNLSPTTDPPTRTRYSDPTSFPRSPSAAAVPLTTLNVGDRGRLHSTRLVVEDREILFALGLAEKSSFRVCKTGDPWIVKVRGTRIGLSPALARHLLVIPDERPGR